MFLSLRMDWMIKNGRGMGEVGAAHRLLVYFPTAHLRARPLVTGRRRCSLRIMNYDENENGGD